MTDEVLSVYTYTYTIERVKVVISLYPELKTEFLFLSDSLVSTLFLSSSLPSSSHSQSIVKLRTKDFGHYIDRENVCQMYSVI